MTRPFLLDQPDDQMEEAHTTKNKSKTEKREELISRLKFGVPSRDPSSWKGTRFQTVFSRLYPDEAVPIQQKIVVEVMDDESGVDLALN